MPPSRERSRLPRKLEVGPYTFKVVYGALADQYGCFEPGSLTITIREGLPPELEAETLHHELMHAIFFANGWNNVMGEEKEEALVGATSPLMFGVWTRNPRLIDYLLGD